MVDDMRVYIANLGKYNEGYLVGDWFSFPIDEEEVAERIGLNSYYEEYAVHDTDNFPIEIGEYVSIEQLNEMYDIICELPDYITDALDEFVSHYGSLEEVYEHKDDVYFYPDCDNMLSCGHATARKIGEQAEAKIIIGRRVLYSVERVKKYLLYLAE